MPSPKPLAAVFGCAGTELSAEERAFFQDVQPLGFILFQRNCENPDQVKALVADLRRCVNHGTAPVLIDQEGGRVARLKPPHWPEFPTAKAYAALYAKDPMAGVDAAFLGGRLIGEELTQLDITVDCAPVLDVPQPGADPIIGDRAFGEDIETIQVLAKAFMDGLMKSGVAPVIKHIPGHGRALVDSHKDLPVVDVDKSTLAAVDFPPFRALHMAAWAMTAHVVYTDLDADNPATLSVHVISQIIRKELRFQGLLVSDDLSMKALSGSFSERASACLAAGCDVALHCNGDMEEMVHVAEGSSVMTSKAWARYKMGELHRTSAAQAFETEEDWRNARLRFDTLMG
ncbi:beta-N-acetylhexosaminidase [Magnetovibrio sp. PR-2]|uniref:beta-N-acetylhexosaminidase n=1 Tax=Magnetovibrio sp. PR-2 TaxID=3120356 RepID=UPI002FCE5623